MIAAAILTPITQPIASAPCEASTAQAINAVLARQGQSE
jgi:hypothetical protein